MFKAVIFDFNGTLFFDTEKHIKAWEKYAESIVGRPLTDDENAAIIGRSNQFILEFLLGRLPTDEELKAMGEEKEAVYRSMCLEDLENFHLAEGVERFLTSLRENNIPLTIATSSPLSNIEFYFENMGIGKWFDVDKIVYDNGCIKGKPEPDIYIAAAKKLGISPEDAIVFEDSFSGIKAAKAAGIGKVVAVASYISADRLAETVGVDKVICDYTSMDFDILCDMN